MAWCGADVIKVESKAYPDVTRLYIPPREPELGIQPQCSPWFTDWNAGKRFVSLDLTAPAGSALARRLVAASDVVIDNNSTGVLAKLGLGFDELERLLPELVLFSSTGYGDCGPDHHYVTWGPNIETLSGLSSVSGFAARDCTMTQFAYPDPLSALHGLCAILAALEHRREHGTGQRIDLSQLETTIAAFGHLALETLVDGREPRRLGNGSLLHAPQGCYPCLGEDRWCVIAVAGETEWQRFCALLERPHWAGDARFADAAARRENAVELDRLIGQWTSSRDRYAVMHLLAGAGIAAGVVQDVKDQLHHDGHLATRAFFEEVLHHRKGTVIAPGIPLGLTGTPGQTCDAGRARGHDNREVFCDLLGLSPEEFATQVADGVIEAGDT
jgi:crotonobetainyl-CoA:carnitine CoA-transferase CaiB-like acyl-CoA transferase